jgi:hypothetical protein
MKPVILDTVAREQRWSRPGQGPASQGERDWWKAQMDELEAENSEETGPGFDWRYLQRCYASPSMKNRRRIWGCVEQIERRVIEYENKQVDRIS